jgi:DNA-directed RNA polymerase specialized sigma24 family protein
VFTIRLPFGLGGWITRSFMPDTHDHLMNLPTHWSIIQKAGDAGSKEWSDLLEYYLPAVQAYLFGCTKDADRTSELVQIFSVQFLKGGFRNANPERGPFRHYLKSSLSNLARKQPKAADRAFEALPDSVPAQEVTLDSPDDQEFLAKIITATLDGAWSRLKNEGNSSSAPYYEVLRWSSKHLETPSEELAKSFSASVSKDYSAERYRRILSRARHKFAVHLYEQVTATLLDPTPDDVAHELAELGLLSHCKLVVEQRRSSSP